MAAPDLGVERRALCLQLTLGAFQGQVIKPEDVVQYAAVLEDYLKSGKPSALKVAGS